MEHIKIYTDKLEKLSLLAKRNASKQKGINNAIQEATWLCCQYFNEPKLFGRYYGYINKIGVEESLKRVALQKEQGIKEPKFFFKKL